MKLRRYHRWLVLPFALILLWVALTGVAMQAIEIYDKGLFPAEDHDGPPPAKLAGLVPAANAHTPEEEAAEAAAAKAAPGTPAAPAAEAPRRPRSKAQQLHGLIQHLHSGEWFGPFGTIIQTLSGLAMIFFAVSGMWMYLDMFRARTRGGRSPSGGKWFW